MQKTFIVLTRTLTSPVDLVVAARKENERA
jgi:hypothetical protein